MKVYTTKYVITTICTIFALISFVLIFVGHYYNDTTSIALSLFLFVAYSIMSFCAGIGAKEDYEDFKMQQTLVKENYFDRLSTLFRKYYWVLSVDTLVPFYSNKKKVLEWAADIAIAAHVHRYDYNTKETNPKVDKDLDLMIVLAKELIENKKYI